MFAKYRATCHKLFGEGDVGPDLTGYERTNLDFMPLAIADPSAAIREEFTNFAVFTNDGRTLSGLIHDQNTRTVTLRGWTIRPHSSTATTSSRCQALPISLMPEGLMTKLTDPEIRNLFAYLMSRAPAASLTKAQARGGGSCMTPPQNRPSKPFLASDPLFPGISAPPRGLHVGDSDAAPSDLGRSLTVQGYGLLNRRGFE